MIIKISTYTDESGQETNWQEFIVCTVVCQNKDANLIEDELEAIEEKSHKHSKWYKSNNKRRESYIKELLDRNIFQESAIYFSRFHNKSDYVSLVASHIVKSIKSYSAESDIDVKIFIDKINKKTLNKIKKEIKLFKIKYSKFRGLDDKTNSLIRLADSVCGMIRDLNNSNMPEIYSKMLKKIHEI